MTYQGHHEDGSGIQKHSAGELYPVVIIGYGDGTWRWVDERRKVAGRRWWCQATVEEVARAWVNGRVSPLDIPRLQQQFQEYKQENGHAD